MQWSRPAIPTEGDPTPYQGSSISGFEENGGGFSILGCGKCSVCRAGKPEECRSMGQLGDQPLVLNFSKTYIEFFIGLRKKLK